MLMMFPYSEHFPAAFDFNGSNVLAKYSHDDVNSFFISYSCTNNDSAASLCVTLDSQGFNQIC